MRISCPNDMPEEDRIATEIVVTEMVAAVQNGTAPRGKGASVRWIRQCSDQCLLAMQNQTAALAAWAAMYAWVHGRREISATMDEMAKNVDVVVVSAGFEWNRRAGIMDEQDWSGDIWDTYDLVIRFLGPSPNPGESEDAYTARASAWGYERIARRYPWFAQSAPA